MIMMTMVIKMIMTIMMIMIMTIMMMMIMTIMMMMMMMRMMMMSRADVKSCAGECKNRVYCRSFAFRYLGF